MPASTKTARKITKTTAPRRVGRPTTRRRPIRVAIIGVGNCASSLVQGVHYYRNAKSGDKIPGLMHVELGGYHLRDVEFVPRSTSTATRSARTSRTRSTPSRTTPTASRMCRRPA